MLRPDVGNGKFWMVFWLAMLVLVAIWGILTFIFWMDSVKNLNALSIMALLLACGASIQASLGMRKTDPKDPL